jgi:transcriptional regulator with XRE-family HTH domain
MSQRIDYAALVCGLREALGLTQEQLAHELGVTFSTVNCWENRKHRPTPSLATRLIDLAREARVVALPGARRIRTANERTSRRVHAR